MQNVCNQKSSLHYNIQYLLGLIIHTGNDDYHTKSSCHVYRGSLPLEQTYADLRCLICNQYILQLPNIWRFVSWHIYSVSFIHNFDRDADKKCYLLRTLTGMCEGEIAPYIAFTILCLLKYVGIDIVLIIALVLVSEQSMFYGNFF